MFNKSQSEILISTNPRAEVRGAVFPLGGLTEEIKQKLSKFLNLLEQSVEESHPEMKAQINLLRRELEDPKLSPAQIVKSLREMRAEKVTSGFLLGQFEKVERQIEARLPEEERLGFVTGKPSLTPHQSPPVAPPVEAKTPQDSGRVEEFRFRRESIDRLISEFSNESTLRQIQILLALEPQLTQKDIRRLVGISEKQDRVPMRDRIITRMIREGERREHKKFVLRAVKAQIGKSGLEAKRMKTEGLKTLLDLSGAGDRAVAELALKLLKDADWQIRLSALNTLDQLKPFDRFLGKKVIVEIRGRLQDKVRKVQDRARTILQSRGLLKEKSRAEVRGEQPKTWEEVQQKVRLIFNQLDRGKSEPLFEKTISITGASIKLVGAKHPGMEFLVDPRTAAISVRPSTSNLPHAGVIKVAVIVDAPPAADHYWAGYFIANIDRLGPGVMTDGVMSLDPAIRNSGIGRTLMTELGAALPLDVQTFKSDAANRESLANMAFIAARLFPEWGNSHNIQGLLKDPPDDFALQLHRALFALLSGPPDPRIDDVLFTSANLRRTTLGKLYAAAGFPELHLGLENGQLILTGRRIGERRAEVRGERKLEVESSKLGVEEFEANDDVVGKIVEAVIEGRAPGRAEVRRFLEILQGRSWAEIEEMMRSAASRLFTTLSPSLAMALLEGQPLPPAPTISTHGEIYGDRRNRGMRGLPPVGSSPVGNFAQDLVAEIENYRTSA